MRRAAQFAAERPRRSNEPCNTPHENISTNSLYRIGQSTDPAAWLRSDFLNPDPGLQTTRNVRHDPGPRRFFRVEAVVPLAK